MGSGAEPININAAGACGTPECAWYHTLSSGRFIRCLTIPFGNANGFGSHSLDSGPFVGITPTSTTCF
jgi:hypothetical protein